jgi:serine/threonine protein phosphatase PrpC
VELARKAMLRHGDVILLCSDGFWGPLGWRSIADAMRQGDIMNQIPRLLDIAEERAGREGDNLSVIAMTWVDDGEATGDWISTLEMRIDEHTTKLSQWGGAEAQPQNYLSDDEIEQAIDEIRRAIRTRTG